MLMVYKISSVMCILIASLLVSGSVVAQETGGVYRWVDAEGQVHYTKTLPPQSAGLPYQRINDAGIVVESVAGAKSEKELAEQAAAELRVIEENKEQEKFERDNRAMLVKYPTIQALEDSLAFNLGRVGSDITIAQTMFDTHVEVLVSEVRHAADLQRAGKPVSAQQHAKVAKLQSEIGMHQDRIDKLQVSVETINTQYEQDRIRYLEIEGTH